MLIVLVKTFLLLFQGTNIVPALRFYPKKKNVGIMRKDNIPWYSLPLKILWRMPDSMHLTYPVVISGNLILEVHGATAQQCAQLYYQFRRKKRPFVTRMSLCCSNDCVSTTVVIQSSCHSAAWFIHRALEQGPYFIRFNHILAASARPHWYMFLSSTLWGHFVGCENS